MSESNINKTRFNTISNQKLSNRNHKTLKQLQLSMLNSLTKSPVVRLRKKPPNNINNHNIDDYEDYINKINTSLKNYQISFSQAPNEVSENNLGPNEKYMDREGKELIKKIYFLNNLNINKGLPTSNDHTKLKITVPEQEYPNPFQSLGVIRSNRFLYDEICKDYLYRQSDLFNKKIDDIQKYKNKFGGGIKMPKIHISPSLNKGLFDIPIIDITDKKGTENTGITHLFPQAGILKLFTYYKYPNKNFPEGREQFSLFMKGSEIIISGGITTNMKALSIWGLWPQCHFLSK